MDAAGLAAIYTMIGPSSDSDRACVTDFHIEVNELTLYRKSTSAKADVLFWFMKPVVVVLTFMGENM